MNIILLSAATTPIYNCQSNICIIESSILIPIFGLIGFVIGFVGGMFGLILGVLRFPFIISSEVSVGVAAGTNIGISTMAAIPAAVRHFRQNNVNIRIFLVMGITGAAGAFCGSFLTRHVPVWYIKPGK